MEENKKENQTQEFYGEKKPNNTNLILIILIFIIVLGIIAFIIIAKPFDKKSEEKNNNDNSINQTTQSDDKTNATYTDDIKEETSKNENITTSNENITFDKEELEVTGKQYVSSVAQYIEERKIDLYAKYINNNESKSLEGGYEIVSIENNTLTYTPTDTKYTLKENNVTKAVGYFSAQSGASIYFITNENKVYEISDFYFSNPKATLIEFKINNVEDIVILEYCNETCYEEGIVFKTTNDKNYLYKNGDLKELIVDKDKIEEITTKPTTVKNTKETTLQDKQDIEDDSYNIYYPISEDRKEYTNIDILYKENETSIVLNEGNLNIYMPNKMMIYNNPDIEKYMIIENDDNNEFSIFFITNNKEIFRMYFKNEALKSFIKYDISNVEHMAINLEDEKNNTILVQTKNNDYMLDYIEEQIYIIKY